MNSHLTKTGILHLTSHQIPFSSSEKTTFSGSSSPQLQGVFYTKSKGSRTDVVVSPLHLQM